ncbi:triose-phosphate isomerase [Candidatus Micrarchaeota archaeon]|nr:MAG: triose-phosphate isomerase [Candidatus Micrarchaeota archaeon]
MKPLIALNFKTYKESLGARGVELCKVAAEVAKASGVRVIVAPQALDLRAACKVGAEVYAQHVDLGGYGAFTGSITAESLREAGVKGSLVNHSERRLGSEVVGKTVARLKEVGVESMVCAQNAEESAELAGFKPTFVAVEPPELIGSGVSVSTAKPEVVTDAVELVKDKAQGVSVLCGAGVSTASDVKKAVELGADGVLLASAYVKAKEPRKLLEEMVASV